MVTTDAVASGSRAVPKKGKSGATTTAAAAKGEPEKKKEDDEDLPPTFRWVHIDIV